MYAHSTGGTFSARRLLRQARLRSDEAQRLTVVYRMYQRWFPNTQLEGKNIEQVPGMEGLRVRKACEEIVAQCVRANLWHRVETAAQTSIPHVRGGEPRCCRSSTTLPIDVPHVRGGEGGLSFVYDIADFYKADLTIPVAFRIAAAQPKELERTVRLECRQAFHSYRIMDRILPDIAEVLNAGNDLGETAEELEGRAVSLAPGNPPGDLPGQPDPEGAG